MIQFLAAWKLQRELGDAEVRTANLPQWGMVDHTTNHTSNGETFIVARDNAMSFARLCHIVLSGRYGRIIIDNYMQRMDCLPDRVASAALFSAKDYSYNPKDDELLINVRSGELAGGVSHYPLVPVDFYQRIIEISCLKPVFMGQIEENAYCAQLKKRYPSAKFLQSQGAIQDFQTVRKGRHIVISVSTFSWLAAWLSNAQRIYLPMLGFLNPMHFREKAIDLLPVDDARYKFFMFPLHFGLPEEQALRHQATLTEFCRELSPQQVNILRTRAPFLKSKTPPCDLDEVWYAHTYMQAAVEISEGWFAGALEHYAEVGIRRGYRPLPEGFSCSLDAVDGSLTDLSLNKSATQSSVCKNSVGVTVEEDATRALCGTPRIPYAFHTDFEDHPWWSVDLEDVCWVRQVVVVNRSETEWILGRATPLVASTSLDRWNWSLLFHTPDALIPGRDAKPLVWTAHKPVKARFVRISVDRSSCLHLRQVRILGFIQNRNDTIV